jgi:hypothetical protein
MVEMGYALAGSFVAGSESVFINVSGYVRPSLK